MIDILGLYAVFSFPFTFGKAALQYAQPLFLASTRMLIAGSLLLGYEYFCGTGHWKVQKKDYGLFAQAIFFQVYIMYATFTWSLKYMSSCKSALIFALAPFITALLCYVLFSEKLGFKKIAGLCIGLVGFLPLLLNEASCSDISQGFFSWPALFALVAVTTYAYGWLISKQLSKNSGYSPMMINGVSMFFGGILLLVTSPLIDTWSPLPFTQFWPFMGYTLLLVLISNIISYNWYIVLLKKYSATLISLAGFTEPLFVAFYSWLFLGEMVDRYFFISLSIIALGLYIFYQEELRQTRQKVNAF